MAQIPKGECLAYPSTGAAPIPVDPGKGCLLGIGTYYFLISVPDAVHEGAHLAWDANVVATSIVLEDSCLPRFKTPADPDSGADASDISSTKGQWIQETSAAVVTMSVVSSDGSTGGATVTSNVIAVAGGTAGGAMVTVNGLASRRARIHVVTTTGGYFRCCPWGKSGG